MAQIDYDRFNRYQFYKGVLNRAYYKFRQDGFEFKEPSDAYRIIDMFCEELSKLSSEKSEEINVTPN